MRVEKETRVRMVPYCITKIFRKELRQNFRTLLWLARMCFELVLTVPFRTCVLIFHVEDPQTIPFLEKAFLTLAIDALRKNIDKQKLIDFQLRGDSKRASLLLGRCGNVYRGVCTFPKHVSFDHPCLVLQAQASHWLKKNTNICHFWTSISEYTVGTTNFFNHVRKMLSFWNTQVLFRPISHTRSFLRIKQDHRSLATVPSQNTELDEPIVECAQRWRLRTASCCEKKAPCHWCACCR